MKNYIDGPSASETLDKLVTWICKLNEMKDILDRTTDHLCGNSPVPAQRPVTQNFDVISDLCLNKQLNNQS